MLDHLLMFWVSIYKPHTAAWRSFIHSVSIHLLNRLSISILFSEPTPNFSEMSLQVKLYVQPDQEIRRFVIDASSNFAALQQRVKELVGRDNIRIYWQDSEGDQIVCGCDDEFQAARQSKDANGLLKLFVRSAKHSNAGGEEKRVHRRITCDGCQGSVAGTRYKCLECPDYDLCEACEGRGTHQEHDMVAIRRPRSCEWKKLFGHGYGANAAGQAGPAPCGPGPRGPCGSRRRGPCGPAGFMAGAPFWGAGLSNLMQNLGQTVEMDIDMNRPLPEVIADITKKVQEAMSRAQSGQQQAGEGQPQENKESDQEKSSAEQSEQDHIIASATAVADAVNVVADMISQTFGGGSQTPSETDGWTHLQKEETAQPEKSSKGEDANESQEQQGPNRIEQALQAMQEMGFGNEGNLLRKLLENFNGDIVRVLDSIK